MMSIRNLLQLGKANQLVFASILAVLASDAHAHSFEDLPLFILGFFTVHLSPLRVTWRHRSRLSRALYILVFPFLFVGAFATTRAIKGGEGLFYLLICLPSGLIWLRWLITTKRD